MTSKLREMVVAARRQSDGVGAQAEMLRSLVYLYRTVKEAMEDEADGFGPDSVPKEVEDALDACEDAEERLDKALSEGFGLTTQVVTVVTAMTPDPDVEE